MFIDKFKDGSGYTYSDGCYYEDLESLLATGVLGFCGCGNPMAVLKYVCNSLQLIDDLEKLVWSKLVPYNEWYAKVKEVLPSEGAEYFMWYFLDNKGFTDHGGAVPGWLTEKGKELLHDLNKLTGR